MSVQRVLCIMVATGCTTSTPAAPVVAFEEDFSAGYPGTKWVER